MSQRLVKQKSIPGGEMEEADEEELVAVKRQATNLAVELESDDELKFEDPIEDADYQEGEKPLPNSRGSISGKPVRPNPNKNRVTFDNPSDDEMTAERKSKNSGPDNFEQKMENFDEETSLKVVESEENGCEQNQNEDHNNDSENADDFDDVKDSEGPKYVGCYERSALQYDNQLFINKYRIDLTPPITTDMLDEEFHLGNEDEYKSQDYSSMFRNSYPYAHKPKKVAKSFHISATKDEKEVSCEKPISDDEDPELEDTDPNIEDSHPKSDDVTSEPFRLPDFPPWYPFSFYSFQRYLDTWEIEREIFDRQVDFIRRKPGRYISPLRHQREALLPRPTLRTTIPSRSPTIPSFRPQWKPSIDTSVRSTGYTQSMDTEDLDIPKRIPSRKNYRKLPSKSSVRGAGYTHVLDIVDLDIPRSVPPRSNYRLGNIQMRLDRLNEKAKSLDNHIKHLKYMLHS